MASVIDARIRARINPLVPQPAGPWSAQVPEIADPERQRFVAELAAAMDARKERIGEHAAEHALPWAVNALGPVPDHPLDRLDWQRRASAIGAYRELYGYGHPTEPIGPEPDCRRAGQAGRLARGLRRPAARSTGPTCAACRTGRCCTCATPTRSKPPGRPSGSATSCAKSAAAPRKPTSPPSGPTPKRRPPGTAGAKI